MYENDFSKISSSIDPDSSFYNEQASFVTDTHNAGITERLDSMDIKDVSISGDTAKVQ